MGEYSTHAKISFCGTQAEISMMKNLLNLINKLDYIDNFAEEFGRLSEKSSLVYDFEFDDDIIENALLGELEDRGEGEHYNRYWPSFDLTLAPKLFAALFPASKFQYSVEVEYSVSINDTPYLTAVFEGDTLMIRESYLYSTVSSNIKKIKAICMNMIKTDPDAKAKYDSYREEEDLEEDEEIDWNFLLSELVDDPTETMASLYKFKKKLPSRNTKYEKSFFSEGDL